MNNVFCADIGTSSLKTAVIDSQGNVVSYSRQIFEKTAVHEESSVWLKALKSAMDEIFASEKECRVDCIAISGNGPTLVGEGGETLLWNAPVPPDCTRAFTSASLFVPRLYPFSKMFPDAWKSSARVFSGPEYLIYLLTGKALTILPEKRFEEAYWTKGSLSEAGLDSGFQKLPDFTAPSSSAGTLTADIAEFFAHQENGIVQGLPVFCGAPDFVAALVGTGTLSPGKLCDRAGSSEGLNLCTAEKIEAPGIRTLPSIIPGLWNASILLPDTGIKFSEYKKRLEEHEGRGMSYDEAVHETIFNDGMDAIYDQGKYMMLEIAMKIRDGLKVLEKAVAGTSTVFPDEFTIAGGQAGNQEWIKMKCDVTGMKANIPVCHDAELMGDAVFAFTGAGVYKDILEASGKLCKFEGLMQGAFLA